MSADDVATTPTAENDAPTYTREDMAEAWEEGYRARKGEGWQSPGADNPYRVIPPDKGRDDAKGDA